MSVRPIVGIDLDAVVHNYGLLCQACPETTVAAVVKDNAYGCGAASVARALYTQAGCRVFFVAYGIEGVAIRVVAPDADIYVLQGFGEEETDIFAKAHLIPVLATPEQLKTWQHLKPNDLKPAIQIETGLNRLGFTQEQVMSLDEETRSGFSLVLSHLACADEPNSPFNQSQLDRFNAMKSLFPRAKFSLAASDGCALGQAYHFDIVRGGAFLYGIHTFPALKKRQKSVMTVIARILLQRKLTQADYVGYGADFHAYDGMRIAVVSIGYGDGLFRCFSPKGRVWIPTDEKNWLPAPVVGRVSMDNIVVDVTHIPESVMKKAHSAFLLCDAQGPDDIGAACNTIGYEVLTALGHNRRSRRYVRLQDSWSVL